MPTYEYACRACEHTFEIVQSMRDEPLTVCPECGGQLRKVFAPPAISFKGSGFYATDHGKKSKTAPASDTPGAGTSDKQEKKAETKTEGTSNKESAAGSSSSSTGTKGKEGSS